MTTPKITPYKLLVKERGSATSRGVSKDDISRLELKIKDLEQQIEETKRKRSQINDKNSQAPKQELV